MRHGITAHVRRNIVLYLALIATLGGTSYAAAAVTARTVPGVSATRPGDDRNVGNGDRNGGDDRNGDNGGNGGNGDGNGGDDRNGDNGGNGGNGDRNGGHDRNGDNGGNGTVAPTDPVGPVGAGSIGARARSTSRWWRSTAAPPTSRSPTTPGRRPPMTSSSWPDRRDQ